MAEAKPWSEASDRNRVPILEVLRDVFTAPGDILEIGSGTGQHAVYLAEHLPHCTWQPSDVGEHLPGIARWLEGAALPNVRAPVELNVTDVPWPLDRVDGVFSANTAHIMSWREVEAMFRGVARILSPGGAFCLYGPFHVGGHPTAESNARFDAMLRARDPQSGLRDRDDLDALGASLGLVRVADQAMPANNRTLVWQR